MSRIDDASHEEESVMTRRKLLVDDLIQSSAQEPWGQSAELCFKILYGLPANLQIRLCCFMMSRYLPIFESSFRKIKWPRQILNNVAQWAEVHGRDVPEEPERADAADAAFSFAFDGLLLAYAYQSHDFTLTSSSVFVIDSAINARETNVWMADDPEAYQMWEEGEWLPPGHTALENCAAIAVSKREWQLVAKWLQQEEVWNYPDDVVVIHTDRNGKIRIISARKATKKERRAFHARTRTYY